MRELLKCFSADFIYNGIQIVSLVLSTLRIKVLLH